MAQLPLITRRDLLNHGAPSDVLEQFRIRPIEVQIDLGGALGAMSAMWRFVGDTGWSASEPSEDGARWTWDVPDPAWASLTFSPHDYAGGWIWTIATNGAVTGQGAAPAGIVSAARVDIVAEIIDGVTSDVVTWTQPRVVPPIVSLGAGHRGWAAQLAVYRLKSRVGMTPGTAGSGDENLRLLAEDAQRNFERIGRSDNRPPDLVDSSANNQGRGIPLMPRSRSPRGFGDFS